MKPDFWSDLALVFMTLVLTCGVLVIATGPLEWAVRRWPGFRAWLDALVERVL